MSQPKNLGQDIRCMANILIRNLKRFLVYKVYVLIAWSMRSKLDLLVEDLFSKQSGISFCLV